jgi:hypothetical protein
MKDAALNLEGVYTLAEAATKLRRSVKTVRKLIDAGKLDANDIGVGARRSLVVTESALDRLVYGNPVQQPVKLAPLPRNPKVRESDGLSGGYDFRGRMAALRAKSKW